jgi:hypothetical protein
VRIIRRLNGMRTIVWGLFIALRAILTALRKTGKLWGALNCTCNQELFNRKARKGKLEKHAKKIKKAAA